MSLNWSQGLSNLGAAMREYNIRARQEKAFQDRLAQQNQNAQSLIDYRIAAQQAADPRLPQTAPGWEPSYDGAMPFSPAPGGLPDAFPVDMTGVTGLPGGLRESDYLAQRSAYEDHLRDIELEEAARQSWLARVGLQNEGKLGVADINAGARLGAAETGAAAKRAVAETSAGARVKSAEIGADSRLGVANVNADARLGVANINAAAKTAATAAANKLKLTMQGRDALEESIALAVQGLIGSPTGQKPLVSISDGERIYGDSEPGFGGSALSPDEVAHIESPTGLSNAMYYDMADSAYARDGTPGGYDPFAPVPRDMAENVFRNRIAETPYYFGQGNDWMNAEDLTVDFGGPGIADDKFALEGGSWPWSDEDRNVKDFVDTVLRPRVDKSEHPQVGYLQLKKLFEDKGINLDAYWGSREEAKRATKPAEDDSDYSDAY